MKIHRFKLPEKQFHTTFAALLFVVFALCLATAAHAQMITTDNLQAAATASTNDLYKRGLSSWLGEDFVASPLKYVGMPSSVQEKLMFDFNAILFSLVTVFGLYFAVRIIANSANDGVVAGNEGNSLWIPIRAGTGIFSMIPAFHGYSLMQAMIIQCAVWGGGGGNITANDLLRSQAGGQSLTPAYASPMSNPNLTRDIKQAAEGMFLANLCLVATNGYSSGVTGVSYNRQITPTTSSDGTVIYDFQECGKVTLHKRQDATSRASSSITGFRSESVNYNAIAQAVQTVAVQQLQTLNATTLQLAQAWGPQLFSSSSATGNYDQLINNSFNGVKSAAATAAQNLNAAVASSTPQASAISQNTIDQVNDLGWMSLGSMNAMFAETSASVADAQHAWQIDWVPGVTLQKLLTKNDGGFYVPDTVRVPLQTYLQATTANESSSSDSILTRVVDSLSSTNAAGNYSVGQSIADAIINLVAADSGGAGLVNPITASKNMGDWLIAVAETGLAVETGFSLASIPVTPTGIAMRLLKNTFAGADGLLHGAFIAMFVIGVGLSVYIPMLPFIIWFGASVACLRHVMETIVHAQLGAFSHIQMRGEGIANGGSSAAKTWIYMVTLCIRPALMVIGYAMAVALMVFFGNLLVKEYSYAMSYAQGNSVTGFFSILAYVCIFSWLLISLVQGSFLIVESLPNGVVNWFGSNGEAIQNMISAAAGAAMMKAFGGHVGSALSGPSTGSTPTTPTPSGKTPEFTTKIK